MHSYVYMCVGLDLYLLSIDEGITGYRDDSLEVYSSPITHLALFALLCLPDYLPAFIHSYSCYAVYVIGRSDFVIE